jgi:hypothetical protein
VGEKIWGGWRWYKELGGGFTTDWGAHMFDIAQKEGDPILSHEADFIEAIRSRREPVVPVEVGHRTGTVCSLGNIAYDLKRPIRWNPQTQTFVSDPEADKHLHRPYREDYRLS